MNTQVEKPFGGSPLEEDAVPLTAMISPGQGTWPGIAQTGADMQWKLSSIDSNDFAACNFAMQEPRVRVSRRLLSSISRLGRIIDAGHGTRLAAMTSRPAIGITVILIIRKVCSL